MKNKFNNYIKFHIGLYGVILLATCFGCSADVDKTLDEGQLMITPIINALTTYYSKNGRFPANINVLITDKYISKLPRLPKKRGVANIRQLSYQVAPDKSFYYLSFSYDFQGYGIGLPVLKTRYYISYKKEWNTSSYPPNFQQLISQHIGNKYKRTGAGDALKIAIEALINTGKRGKSTICKNLSRARVIACLGKGDKINLPNSINCTHGIAEIYASANNTIKYCFVYIKKDILPNHGYYLKDPYVVSAIYFIQSDNVEKENWEIVEKCY